MKKAIFALVALMVAGLASAVTVDWSKATWTTLVDNEAVTAGWSQTFQRTGDFAMRVTYVGTAQDNVTAWRRLYKLKDGNRWNEFQNAGTNGNSTGVWGGVSNSNGQQTQTQTLAGISFANGAGINLSLIFLYNASTKNLELFALDNITGTTDKIITVENITLSESITFAAGTGVDNDRGLTGLFADGTTYTLDYTTNIASLPEPTVLALLALGVGAIALKRKVA